MYINIHQALIDRCLLNDKEAQYSLYKLYYRSMYNTSLRIVNNSDDAEDIMQESFLTAFQKLGTYKGEVSFGIWLKRIVVNRSLDYLRKRKVAFEEVSSDLPVFEEERENEPAFTVEEVKNAISQLADGYRTILSLLLLEGYDHEEVSEILGISNVTSRTQFCRAKQLLRELLIDKRVKQMTFEQYG
ncbi:MAG: sigma-70 family RNA polymerase sigma factor [Prolixibacteraceae bacterium]|nr:sigma-70 family RNA polymerase sigma factor [Prolixibacteraceae bacterium]